nr:SH3 domain binding protein 5 [Hymenolepis microstoma]
MDHDNDVFPAVIAENVQARLNTLNYASSLINKNCTSLDKVRKDYQALLTETCQTLSTYSKRLKSSIGKARPYHELQAKKKALLAELQRNSEAYSAISTEYDKAKDVLNFYNIDVAKFDLSEESQLEVVNNAIQKVNSTKLALATLKSRHAELLTQCAVVDSDISRHRSSASLAIRKSQVYFDLQASFNQRMEEAKAEIDRLTAEVESAKKLYSETMSSLEAISNRIHESRRLGHWLNSPPTSPRLRGVGADGSCSSELTPAEAGTSLPSSPRRTPPGQDDTDTEAMELEGADTSDFFGFHPTLRKPSGKRLISELTSNLESCTLTMRTKGEQTDLLPVEVKSLHSRSQSL